MGRPIDRLSIVYDAQGGIVGELAYAIGRARGTHHCALCGLTHGRIRERPAWRAFRASLPVPVAAFHLNDRPPEVAAASGGTAPAVVAHTGAEAVLLLGRERLEAIGADLDAFGAALDEQRRAAGLEWPS